MKIRTISVATLLVLVMVHTTTSQGVQQTQNPSDKVIKQGLPPVMALPDISCRAALYFGGEFPEGENGQAFAKIANLPNMLKGARYVVADATITLTKSESLWKQPNGDLVFNLGYFLFINTPSGAPAVTSAVNRVRIGDKLLAQTKQVPAPGQEVKAIHTQVSLPIGESTLTLTLDDDHQVPESNEKNNVYNFKVIVQP